MKVWELGPNKMNSCRRKIQIPVVTRVSEHFPLCQHIKCMSKSHNEGAAPMSTLRLMSLKSFAWQRWQADSVQERVTLSGTWGNCWGTGWAQSFQQAHRERKVGESLEHREEAAPTQQHRWCHRPHRSPWSGKGDKGGCRRVWRARTRGRLRREGLRCVEHGFQSPCRWKRL